MSDHKPVSAEFSIAARLADESAYQRQLRKLVEQVEDLVVDTDSTPKLKLQNSEVQFGDIWFDFLFFIIRSDNFSCDVLHCLGTRRRQLSSFLCKMLGR